MWTPSPEFVAGYISGAAGIVIGNPFDVIKVRLQAGKSSSKGKQPDSSLSANFKSPGSLIRGITAPLIGYGALNAILFLVYNRSLTILNHHFTPDGRPAPHLWTTFVAGTLGGLATVPLSCPMELIKCRVQQPQGRKVTSSIKLIKAILHTEGIRGLYTGAVVTGLRDSIGYGFYFWSYEIASRLMLSNLSRLSMGPLAGIQNSEAMIEAAKVLFCGGVAGVICWATVFPLDVVKTRVQTQKQYSEVLGVRAPLLGMHHPAHHKDDIVHKRKSTMGITKELYKTKGVKGFWVGIGICSLRAFIVNAVTWAAYEYMMKVLDPDWRKKSAGGNSDKMVV